MPLIWAAISAHGYGHAAQVVPVLNALGRIVPGLHAILRTTVPASFFQDRLTIPWEHHAVQQDVGCIQEGPLTIDVDATWREHTRFHRSWEERLEAETAAMAATRPALVVADIPYLALAAGKRAGIPVVALASFTWDLVLTEYPAPSGVETGVVLETMRAAYAGADLALRMAPAPKLDVFQRLVDIRPVAEPSVPARQALRETLGLAPEERSVLIGFGGIPLSSLPFDRLESLDGFCLLFDGTVPSGSRRVRSGRALPFSFKTLLASADIIMTKPGYGTIVEAVALGQPVIYVRRYNFADEQVLVDYLHRHGRGVELPRDDFFAGRWEAALKDICTTTASPHPPVAGGAEEAAAFLAPYCANVRG
jgi:hypothetical protein